MGIFDWLFGVKNFNIENDNGTNTIYYDQGNTKERIRETFSKKDGLLHGKYYEEFRWGNVKQVGQYKNGKKDGKWIYNGEDGTSNGKSLGWVVYYKNGVMDGKFEVYKLLFQPKFVHDNTYEKILVEEGKCVNGIKEGEWNIYIPQTKKNLIKLNGLIDIHEEVFLEYKNKYKIKYVKGVLTDNPDNLTQKEYPELNSEKPKIYLNTISDPIRDYEDSRKFNSSFIDRT